MEEEEDKRNEIPNIIEYLEEKQRMKDKEKKNFENKEIIQKLKQESFEGSVIVTRMGKTK
jgi:hypothetical protein